MSRRERAEEVLRTRPFTSAVIFQVATLGVAILVGAAHPRVWPSHAPKSPGDAFMALWQVDAVFVSLAFAGLAVLFQLGTEQLVSGNNLRAVLFRYTRFQFTFAFCVAGLVQLGVAALWFATSAAIVVEFIAAAAVSVAVVSAAYWRAAEVYTSPSRARVLAWTQLRETLRTSQFRHWAIAEANRRLTAELPEIRRFMHAPQPELTVHLMVPRDGDGYVRDLNINLLADAMRYVTLAGAEMVTSSDPAYLSSTAPARGALLISADVGGRVGSRGYLFEVRLPEVHGIDLTRLEGQLASAVEWSIDEA